jgi:hypothetical protein
MEQKHKQCLLLNADYSPLSIISWQKAIIWSIRFENNPRYGIEIIDFYKNDHINGVDKKYPIPAVTKTQRFFRINNQDVIFSRKNIFIRDNYTCQYCHKQYEMSSLTYDHVIPKSKWTGPSSPTSWTNIVTACTYCNRKKGNKTPKQANMPLIKLPIKPNKNMKFLPIAEHLLKIKDDLPEEWKTYLPESYL